MTTDRELLEQAAKAAGYEPSRVTDDGVVLLRGVVVCWNPLSDDGDALRLAVALRLSVHIDKSLTDVDGAVTEAHLGDPFAATRRAIVRAAAELGKAKP